MPKMMMLVTIDERDTCVELASDDDRSLARITGVRVSVESVDESGEEVVVKAGAAIGDTILATPENLTVTIMKKIRQDW